MFLLAEVIIEKRLDAFCQAYLFELLLDFLEIELDVDEVSEVLVERHLRVVLAKLVEISLEAEAKAKGLWIREDLSQDLVEGRVVLESQHVDKVGCVLVAQLKYGWRSV